MQAKLRESKAVTGRSPRAICKVKENLMSTYNRHRQYYDRKAGAAAFELYDYCLMLDPTAVHQSSILHKKV